ncbi:MAG: integrase arm-type DNA-binding domain-containing protein [Thiotrichales bacterium]|nr:integrase arm-type DNA-binding domain-containing protein [Thiotrichales bacterium]
MALTDTLIKQAQPSEKQYKLSDAAGLFLLIHPNGSKYWRLKYRIAGKEKTLALGVYPETSLKQARAHRDDARKLIANGSDPAEVRKAEKITITEERRQQSEAEAIERMIQQGETLPGSFEAVALEWFYKQEAAWVRGHSDKILARLKNYVFPYLGRTPIAEVTAPQVLQVLERIEERGTIETAHRTRQTIGQVLRYAVAKGLAPYDPTQALRGALKPYRGKHLAAVTEPAQIAPLLRIMAGYRGSPITKAALTIAPLVFVRPGELRAMEWEHIDWDAAEWRYTTSKTGQDHLVPLARQVIEALRELYPLTGHGRYVFPSTRTDARPMSNNTVNAALKRLGIDTQTELTGHGFRAMARTVLEEVHDFRPEVIELQLAHAVRDPLGRAYNRTKHLAERKRMMQVWADYLDELREAKNVIHGNFGKSA